MNKYNSILFDLDGTLTNSGIGITKGVQYALNKFNIEITDLKLLNRFIGPPLNDSFINYYHFTKGDAIKALNYYREYYSEIGIFENELYTGIGNLLTKLLTINYNLFIATSKPTIYAYKVCDYFGITEYFIDIQGSDMDQQLANKTEIIKQVITKHQLNKSETIMVGDREHDVIGAKNNTIECIGVGYGYGSKDELVNSGAILYAKDVSELSQILIN